MIRTTTKATAAAGYNNNRLYGWMYGRAGGQVGGQKYDKERT